MQMGCSKVSAEATARTACKSGPHLVSEQRNIQIFCKCCVKPIEKCWRQGTSKGYLRNWVNMCLWKLSVLQLFSKQSVITSLSRETQLLIPAQSYGHFEVQSFSEVSCHLLIQLPGQRCGQQRHNPLLGKERTLTEGRQYLGTFKGAVNVPFFLGQGFTTSSIVSMPAMLSPPT